jgi:heme/copper-type cytochrome/quinol oxidase subunit 2
MIAISINTLLSTQSIFDASSLQAKKIVGLDYGFLIAAAAVLILVVTLTGYIVIKFRAK